jgi:hypothetical protein
VAFLDWRFGLSQMTAWRIEVAPVPGLSNVATPQNLSIPSQSHYMDMGMVMMPKKGSRQTARWAGAWGAQARQSPSLYTSHSAFESRLCSAHLISTWTRRSRWL